MTDIPPAEHVGGARVGTGDSRSHSPAYRQRVRPAESHAGGSRHPLPWRNRPSNGENHVSDADGRAVYDGPDAAEMFRLYAVQALAERGEGPDASRAVRASQAVPTT